MAAARAARFISVLRNRSRRISHGRRSSPACSIHLTLRPSRLYQCASTSQGMESPLPAERRAFCCWRPNGGSRMPLSAVLRDRASPLATNEREETPAAMAAPMTREDDARAYERHAGHDMQEPPALSRKA